jgi:hypothetical protein
MPFRINGASDDDDISFKGLFKVEKKHRGDFIQHSMRTLLRWLIDRTFRTKEDRTRYIGNLACCLNDVRLSRRRMDCTRRTENCVVGVSTNYYSNSHSFTAWKQKFFSSTAKTEFAKLSWPTKPIPRQNYSCLLRKTTAETSHPI